MEENKVLCACNRVIIRHNCTCYEEKLEGDYNTQTLHKVTQIIWHIRSVGNVLNVVKQRYIYPERNI